MSIDELRPETAPGLPDVDWGMRPATVTQLYEQYGNEIAAVTIHELQRIRAAEPEITAALQEAARSTRGARMTEDLLAFRVKSPQSLARKIAARVQIAPGLAPTRAVGRLTDVIRYTVVVDRHRQLVSSARSVLRSLQAQGWEVVEAEHSYVDGNPYKGLHLIVRAPSGHSVEVQVHSTDSQSVKDRMHADYEIERDGSTPMAERAAARSGMVCAWSRIPRPPGLTKLSLGGVQVIEKKYPNRY